MNTWAIDGWRQVGRQLWQHGAAAWREVGATAGSAGLRADLKEAISSLRVNKQRSLLALFGIVVGIGSVTAMTSIATVAKAETAKRFQELGVETLVIRRGPTTSGRTPVPIRLADVRAMPGELASITAAAPAFQLFSTLSHGGESMQNTAISGVTASFAALNKLSLSAGRFVSDLDIHRYYCVLGWEIADALRPGATEQLVGEAVSLTGRLYTVVGILQRVPAASGMSPNQINRAAFVPITTGLRALPGAEIQFIVARRDHAVHHTVAEAEVQGYFRRKAGLTMRVQNAERLIEQLQGQMRLFTLLLGAIGSIALIVGGVGVMNVMLASVTERRREIGVRRALGARRRDISKQFLVESVVLALLGGSVGAALGVAAAWGICVFSDWTFLVSATGIALGVAVASAVGVFFGFYPAYQAARLDPITAMRAE